MRHVFAAILLLGSTTYSVDPQHRGRHDVRPAGTLSNDPNVLVSKCLDAAREAHITPLGCWPNTTAVATVSAR